MFLEWFPHPDFKPEPHDIPRKLTIEEIEEIVNNFPEVKGSGTEPRELARLGIINRLYQFLQGVVIAPSRINYFAQIIYYMHAVSMVIPKSSIGIIMGDAFGAGITQMTLNTHKVAGTSVDRGSQINRTDELIYARKVPKNPINTIHFTRKVSFDEVYEMKAEIVECKILHCINSSLSGVPEIDIIYANSRTKYWWEDACFQLRKARGDVEDELDNFNSLDEKISDPHNALIRIQLNKTKMFANKILVTDVVKLLESDSSKTGSGIFCIYSPLSWMNEGEEMNPIIDIYTREDNFKPILEKEKVKMIVNNTPEALYYTKSLFFRSFVIPEFTTLKIKGIEGIKELVPKRSNLTRVIKSEDKIEKSTLDRNSLILYRRLVDELNDDKYNSKNLWVIYYNHSVVKSTGITKHEIRNLFEKFGIKVLDNVYHKSYPSQKFYYQPRSKIIAKRRSKEVMAVLKEKLKKTEDPDEIREIKEQMRKARFVDEHQPHPYLTVVVTPNNLSPKKIIEKRVTDAKKVIAEMRKIDPDLKGKEKSIAMREVIERVNRSREKKLIDATEFIYAETHGANLKELLSLDIVDKNRLITSNIHEAERIYGIEAARYIYLREMDMVLRSSGADVSPTYQTILADVTTMRGTIYGSTHHGNIKRSVGPLSKASNEQARVSITSSAISSSIEDTKNPNASTIVGKRFVLGTGAANVKFHEEKIKAFEQKMKEYNKATGKRLKHNLKGIVTSLNDDLIRPNIMTIGRSSSGDSYEFDSVEARFKDRYVSSRANISRPKLSSTGLFLKSKLSTGAPEALKSMRFNLGMLNATDFKNNYIRIGEDPILPSLVRFQTLSFPKSILRIVKNLESVIEKERNEIPDFVEQKLDESDVLPNFDFADL